jgi:hypothetical protein
VLESIFGWRMVLVGVDALQLGALIYGGADGVAENVYYP